VEKQDDLRFGQRLQPEQQHARLDGQCGQRQEIIAMQQRVGGVEEMGGEQQCQHQCAEQARPALLEAEQQEFVEPQPPASARVELFEPQANRFEAAVLHRD
jgi:hypothetical protein